MSDLSSSATTEKTPIPKSSETAIPITAESSTPATGETAIIITEEIATPVQGETSIPMTEETGTLEIEETSIPMTEMDSDKPEDPELVPDSEDQSFKALGQLLNDFGSGTLRFTGMTNGILGVLLFFLQLWAILVSPKGVDMDLFGMLAGIYLLMLAFMKFEKVRSIDFACYLTTFAIGLGATMVTLHSLSIYLCGNLYDSCIKISETGNISTDASCRWFNQRLIVDSLMVACGIVIVISNGVVLYVLYFLKTTTRLF